MYYKKTLRNLIRLSKVKNKNNIRIKIDKKRIRPIDADLQVPSIKKFVKHTGWKPQITFDKTCNDLLEYWRNEIDKTSNYFNR